MARAEVTCWLVLPGRIIFVATCFGFGLVSSLGVNARGEEKDVQEKYDGRKLSEALYPLHTCLVLPIRI